MVHIMTCETAAEMFEKLVLLFQKPTEEIKCEILEEFFSATYDKSKPISTHIGKLEEIFVRLKATDPKGIDDSALISKILSTLPDKLNYFKSAWDSTPKNERTLEDLKHRLFTEEERNGKKPETSVAFQANSKQLKCWNCDKVGHLSRKCKAPRKKNEEQKKNKMWCQTCRMSNHTDKMCYKSKDKSGDDNKNKVSFLAHARQYR
nr:PREDICTED: uncharacterized protein LOC109041563 [Bemisia tabaci]